MSSRDIKDRARAFEILKANARSGRIFSGYIFAGADAGSKLASAKNFAKAVNCPAEGADPCESCASCGKINSGNHPDVFLIEPGGASSSIGIDRIRAAIRQANLKPYEAKKKVFIINEAHAMNLAASNAFLKTLEEPPHDTVFILISRSKELLLPTIVSRCQVIKFSARRVGTEAPASKQKNKESLKETLDGLLAFFRDVFLYKATGAGEALFCKERIDEIKRESRRYDAGELDRLIKKMITLRSYADYNVNPKIITDVLNNEIKRKDIHARSSTSKAA